MESLRLKKLAANFHHELNDLIQTQTNDPLLNGVWITQVKLTPDVREANIYFSASDGKNRQLEILKGLRRSKGFLKKEIGQRIRMRFTPELNFYYDETDDITHQIDSLFQKLDEEKSKKSHS